MSSATPTAEGSTRSRLDQTTVMVPPGLAGVVVADTAIGDVRGFEGFYHYRGHSATELARKVTFEDVWHLMLIGHLPDADERVRFAARVAALRAIPEAAATLLPAIAAAMSKDPLGGVRTVLTLVAAERGLPALYDQAPEQRLEAALMISAVTPTVLSALHRLRTGQVPLTPREDLGTAANYLFQVSGEMPGEAESRALDAYLISTVDHGFNASTFTARVVASTGADLTACVVAALGALSGPLHGGAPSRVLDMLDEIADPARIGSWAENAVRTGGRIMGFGHPIYRTEDPRSAMLKEIARTFGGPRVDLALAVEEGVLATLAELKPGRALHTNVEFYAAVVMERCGIPQDMFTSTFAAARVVGWTAHILEQASVGKIIRPSSHYVGPGPSS